MSAERNSKSTQGHDAGKPQDITLLPNPDTLVLDTKKGLQGGADIVTFGVTPDVAEQFLCKTKLPQGMSIKSADIRIKNKLNSDEKQLFFDGTVVCFGKTMGVSLLFENDQEGVRIVKREVSRLPLLGHKLVEKQIDRVDVNKLAREEIEEQIGKVGKVTSVGIGEGVVVYTIKSTTQ